MAAADVRLLIDPPLTGPANMARDEALLAGCTGPGLPITLRFYAWSPPTISLGYFQGYEEYLALPAPAGGLPVVRRTTGGGAILHDLEVTYAIVIPLSHSLVRGRPNHLYELAHRAVIEAIEPANDAPSARLFGTGGGAGDEAACGESACGDSPRRGPFFCFARRHALDVVVADSAAPGGLAKLAGSAQRRSAAAILQHGSIILDSRFRQQPVATWRAIGGVSDFDDAVARLTPCFERHLEASIQPDDWSSAELSAAAGLERIHAGVSWRVERER
jgi:lipoate-protein ligase A